MAPTHAHSGVRVGGEGRPPCGATENRIWQRGGSPGRSAAGAAGTTSSASRATLQSLQRAADMFRFTESQITHTHAGRVGAAAAGESPGTGWVPAPVRQCSHRSATAVLQSGHAPAVILRCGARKRRPAAAHMESTLSTCSPQPDQVGRWQTWQAVCWHMFAANVAMHVKVDGGNHWIKSRRLRQFAHASRSACVCPGGCGGDCALPLSTRTEWARPHQSGVVP